jgi:predicted O-methyltransferase YrrM
MTLHAQYQARAGGAWSDIRDHLDFIYDRARGRRVIAELGVRNGHSTCALLAAIEVTGSGELWSVDVNPPQVPEIWRALPYWHFLQADDITPAARDWVPAGLDLLFIDTSHEQDHTLAELTAYAPRVRPGGIILAHDTCWIPGDTDLGVPVGPVARALDVWCQASPSGLTWENRPGSYGLGVIEVPAEPGER